MIAGCYSYIAQPVDSFQLLQRNSLNTTSISSSGVQSSSPSNAIPNPSDDPGPEPGLGPQTGTHSASCFHRLMIRIKRVLIAIGNSYLGQGVFQMIHLSILQFGINMGLMAGGLLGLIFKYEWGLYWLLTVQALLNLINLLWVIFLVPDRPSVAQSAQRIINYGALAQNSAAIDRNYARHPSYSSNPSCQESPVRNQGASTSDNPIQQNLLLTVKQHSSDQPFPPTTEQSLCSPIRRCFRACFGSLFGLLGLSVQLFADTMYTTFIKKKVIPFGRTKVLLALLFIWVYGWVGITESQVYLFMANPFSGSVYAGVATVLVLPIVTWFAVNALLPALKYIFNQADDFTFSAIVVFCGLLFSTMAHFCMGQFFTEPRNWIVYGFVLFFFLSTISFL